MLRSRSSESASKNTRISGSAPTRRSKYSRERKSTAEGVLARTVAVAVVPRSREISPNTSPDRKMAIEFCRMPSPVITSSSPARTTNRPRPISPSRMTSVAGAISWPVKRRARSSRCCGEKGRNSGEVASRFLSKRSRVNRCSTSATALSSPARARNALQPSSITSTSVSASTVATRGWAETSASSPKMDPSPRRPSSCWPAVPMAAVAIDKAYTRTCPLATRKNDAPGSPSFTSRVPAGTRLTIACSTSLRNAGRGSSERSGTGG